MTKDLPRLLAGRREKFLLVLGSDPKRWAERFGIEPFSHPCIDCGEMLSTSLPFACDSLRGLIAPRCSCGNDRPPYCVVGSGVVPKSSPRFIPDPRDPQGPNWTIVTGLDWGKGST